MPSVHQTREQAVASTHASPSLHACMTSASDQSLRAEAALLERDERWAGLLRASAQGGASGHEAFERFYDESAPLALGIARRVAGAAFAEDVLSEAYLQAWRQAALFDATRGRASTWLLTIVRSRALDKLRSENLRRTQSLDIDEEGEPAAAAEPADEAPGPEALLNGQQQFTRLHRALADLSAHERWVIGLAYYQDLSHSEIAQRTGLPLGTVKSLASRGVQKLRVALNALVQ
jgi:RNA polymerase sigma-70 factor, ECF subfamily